MARKINPQVAAIFEKLATKHGDRYFYRVQTPQRIDSIFIRLDSFGYESWLEIGTATYNIFSYEQIVADLLASAKRYGFYITAAYRALGIENGDNRSPQNRIKPKNIVYYVRLAELSEKTVYLVFKKDGIEYRHKMVNIKET